MSKEKKLLPDSFEFTTKYPGNSSTIYRAVRQAGKYYKVFFHYNEAEYSESYTRSEVARHLDNGNWVIVPPKKTLTVSELVQAVKEDIQAKEQIELKVGDRVKVVRKVEGYHPDGMGPGEEWLNSWIPSMDDAIGKTATIVEIDLVTGYSLRSDELSCWDDYDFPLLALERVEEPEAETEVHFTRKLEVNFEGGRYVAYDDQADEMVRVYNAVKYAQQEVEAYEKFLADKQERLQWAEVDFERFKVA